MIQFIRHHWRIVKSRVRALLTKADRESVEALGVLALGWQSNRLALANGWHAAPSAQVDGGLISIVGRQMIDSSNTFWQSLVNQSVWFNLGVVSVALIAVTALALVGLLEEWTRVRLVTHTVGAAWWLWSGFMLSLHTPWHIGGGLYLILGAAAGWVVIGLYARMGAEDYARSVAGRTRTQVLDIGHPEAGHVTREVYTPVITRSDVITHTEQTEAIITRTTTGGKT